MLSLMLGIQCQYVCTPILLPILSLHYSYILIALADNAVIQLNRYLLRTLCSDLFNFVVLYLADDTGVTQLPESEFTVKVCGRVTNLVKTMFSI